jgi:hypothetical protein
VRNLVCWILPLVGLTPIVVGQEVYYSQGMNAQPVYAPGAYATQPYALDAAPYVEGAAPCASANCGHCCRSHCSRGCCVHRSGMFGEFLYWQATGADTSFAVPQDGIGAIGTVPLGDVGLLDYDHDSAFRTGFQLALNCNSSIGASFTKFETTTNNTIDAAAPQVIQPLVMFPGTFNAGFTAQQAHADSSLELDVIDLEYRAVLISGPRHYLNFMTGARYASLDQSFSALFPFAPPDGTTLVVSDLDFEGVGLRIGLDGERFVWPHLGLSIYGKSTASLLAGEMSGIYGQVNQFNGIEAFETWEDDRLVPTVDLELGLQWANRSGRIRLSGGYYVGVWGNMVTTAEWINGAQALNFVDISRDSRDEICFDGLVTRAELRL